MLMNIKRLISTLVIIGLVTAFFSGCFKKEVPETTKTGEAVELVYYKMFDEEDVIKPLIQQYQSDHRNVKITYRKFTDLEEYQDLIVNELAEGEGPDIFSVPNYPRDSRQRWHLP